MFSGHGSLNVIKAKFNSVWERRGETEWSIVVPALSHAHTCLAVRQGAQPRQVRVEKGVPSHSLPVVSRAHGPVCVHMFYGSFRSAVSPHRMAPDKRGSKCCCLMSCRLRSFSLGGRYFPTEPYTCLGCGYNGRQTRDQSSLLLDSSTRDLTTIFHSADEL